jgi:hypothetical protein
MIALIITLEGYVARRGLDLADPVSHSWRFSAKAARGPEAKADVLCFGDSLVKMGVLPRVISAGLGERAYNLAVFSGQAPSTFFLFRQVLVSGARPRAVIVDFHANLLATVAKENRLYWPELVDSWDGLELAFRAADPGLLGALVADRFLPTIKHRFEVRRSLLAALRGETSPSVHRGQELRSNWCENDGAHFAEFRLPPSEPPRASHNARWSPRPLHSAYIRRFLDLAATHGITVYWLIPPLNPAWQAHRERVGIEESYTRFVQSMSAGRTNLIVVDGRRLGLSVSQFADATHLNGEGAVILSSVLARVMRSSQLDTTRWVEITPEIAANPRAFLRTAAH